MEIPQGYRLLESSESLQQGDYVVFNYHGSLKVCEIIKIGKKGRGCATGGRWFPSVFGVSMAKWRQKCTFRLRKENSNAKPLFEPEMYKYNRRGTIDSKLRIGTRRWISANSSLRNTIFEYSEKLDIALENSFIPESDRVENVRYILCAILDTQKLLSNYCPTIHLANSIDTT